MLNDANLDRLTSLVREIVEPQKVVLFGSRASGTFKDDSDYDICVIVDDDQDEREITRKINRQLYESAFPFAADVITVQSTKFKAGQKNISYVYRNISRDGIVIYGR